MVKLTRAAAGSWPLPLNRWSRHILGQAKGPAYESANAT
jgi:hypothetical protein